MNKHSTYSIVFSDLDGCLLNHDYTFEEARPALARLRELNIPLVLASSKTEAEMLPIAKEVGTNLPLICENGGIIAWRGFPHADGEEQRTILGTPRAEILALLKLLSGDFKFRSFDTLGISGIIESTGLTTEQAERAAQRHTTEPLIWDDEPDRVEMFRERVESEGLSLTRGGRFWHVAGRVNKGDGLEAVLSAYQSTLENELNSVAIGDSPIDLPMLEKARHAIVIPGRDGKINIHPENPNALFAQQQGSAGWNAELLNWIEATIS